MIWLVKIMPFNDFKMMLSVVVNMKMKKNENDKTDLNALDDPAHRVTQGASSAGILIHLKNDPLN